MTRVVLAAFFLTGLSACATEPGQPSRYSTELRTLEAECRARDGILTPIPGANSGRPAADFQCELRGGPDSRLRTGS